MSQILETAMLICFGCSWPISVYHNIKARSAKAMSLKFTMLIILGYVAGITAKLISHSINYVLVVYIINLLIVSVNIVVYFINRKYDVQEVENDKEYMEYVAGQPAVKNGESDCDNSKISKINLAEMKKYERMNKTAQHGAAVIFGTDYLKQIDFGELAEGCGETFYNRSFTGLTVDCAANVIKDTLHDIKPQSLFVNIGETEAENGNFNCDDFIEKYRRMISSLRDLGNADIYIVSIVSDSDAAQILNDGLKALSKELDCEFINGARTLLTEYPDYELFKLMHSCVRRTPMSFVEAMEH